MIILAIVQFHRKFIHRTRTTNLQGGGGWRTVDGGFLLYIQTDIPYHTIPYHTEFNICEHICGRLWNGIE